MSNKKGLEPAFPSNQTINWNNGEGESVHKIPGMSKRLWIATMAMQGMVTASLPHPDDVLAKFAFNIADAMLEAEEK